MTLQPNQTSSPMVNLSFWPPYIIKPPARNSMIMVNKLASRSNRATRATEIRFRMLNSHPRLIKALSLIIMEGPGHQIPSNLKNVRLQNAVVSDIYLVWPCDKDIWNKCSLSNLGATNPQPHCMQTSGYCYVPETKQQSIRKGMDVLDHYRALMKKTLVLSHIRQFGISFTNSLADNF
jgi:hypothetical protein